VIIGDNFYIYCIASKIDIDEASAVTGLQGEPVFEVIYRDIAAFASKTKFTHLEASLENLQVHENVIAELMKNRNVLPMSFSTICSPKVNISMMLEKYYDQFKKNLDYVAEKVELGIKVFYKLDAQMADKAETEEIKNPKAYMMKRYEKYLERKKQVEDVLSGINNLHKDLSAIASDSCYTKPFRNNLIFNASYLVERARKDEFVRMVEEGVDKYPTYKILFSGPWPAYHFVKIIREGEEDE
jgi:hypothetical protein